LAYHFEDVDLEHALVEVGRAVLHHLDGDYLARVLLAALHHLAKRALAKQVQHDIPTSQTTDMHTTHTTHVQERLQDAMQLGRRDWAYRFLVWRPRMSLT
jgi:hypothetical protein